MRTHRLGTPKPSRALTITALTVVLGCGLLGLWVTPSQAGPAERDVLPSGKSAGEILKETKPANPAGAETRPPCAPPRDPWTECKNRQLYQCRQILSHFGTAICNYRQRCTNTGRHC